MSLMYAGSTVHFHLWVDQNHPSSRCGVTKVPGIGPTRGAALLRLGVLWKSSDRFKKFSPKILRSFFWQSFQFSGATMISSALSRLRRQVTHSTQGTRSRAPENFKLVTKQEGSLDVPGITSKLQQNIVQCPPSCSRVHMVWSLSFQWFQERSSDVMMLSWVWSVKKILFFFSLPALPEHGKLPRKDKH